MWQAIFLLVPNILSATFVLLFTNTISSSVQLARFPFSHWLILKAFLLFHCLCQSEDDEVLLEDASALELEEP